MLNNLLRFMTHTIGVNAKIRISFNVPAKNAERAFLASVGSAKSGYTVAMTSTPRSDSFVDAWLPRVSAVIGGVLGVAQDVFDGDPCRNMVVQSLLLAARTEER